MSPLTDNGYDGILEGIIQKLKILKTKKFYVSKIKQNTISQRCSIYVRSLNRYILGIFNVQESAKCSLYTFNIHVVETDYIYL